MNFFSKMSWWEWAIVGGILLFLWAVAQPNIQRTRPEAKRMACVANLKQIQAAKTDWSAQNQHNITNIPTLEDLFSTNRALRPPICPSGGEYTVGSTNTNPRCSLEYQGHKL